MAFNKPTDRGFGILWIFRKVGLVGVFVLFCLELNAGNVNIQFVSSFTGENTYCLNQSASNLTITLNTCTGSGGKGTPTTFTITWYYNTTNSTTIAGATQVSQIVNQSTGTGSTISFTYLPSTATIGDRYYFVVLSSPSNSDCGFSGTLSSLTQKVSVNPIPTAAVSPVTQNVCSGVAITPINITNPNSVSGTAFTYSYTNASLAGIPAGSGSNISGALVNISITNQNAVFTVVASANGCSSSTNATVTVYPSPSINIPSTKTICSNTGTNITLGANMASTYIWTIGTITGGITGASAGSGSTINQTLINPSNSTAGTVKYIVTPTSISNLCTGNSFIITVTVNPTPLISLVSDPSTSTQTSCISSPITNITYSVSGASGLSFSGLPAGVSVINDFPQYTITGSPTASGSFNYSVAATGSSCLSINATGSIWVAALLDPGTISRTTTGGRCGVTLSGTPVFCPGTGTEATYSWYSSQNGQPPWTLVPGSTTNDLQISDDDVIVKKLKYKRVVTCGSCNAEFEFKQPIAPNMSVTITSTPVTCFGSSDGTATATVNGGTAPYTYVWSNTQTTQTATGLSYGQTYSVNVTDNAAPPGCKVNNTTVIIGGSSSLPTASISGSTQVCLNAASPTITFTGSGGTGPYTFTYNINGGPSITTATGTTINVSAPTGTSGPFTYNLTSVKDAYNCEQPITASATITVNPLPTATISGTTAVCQNATAPDITFTGANGTAPYTFTYKINGGTNLTVTTVSGNSVTVSVPTGTTGPFVYTLVSVKDASSTTCSKTIVGQTATITVNYPPVITTQPKNQTDCYYNVVTFETAYTSTGGVSFQWYRFEGGAWVPYGVEGTSILSPIKLVIDHAGTLGNLNGTQYKVVIWDNCGSVTSETAILTVNNIVYKNEIIKICTGEDFSLSVTTTGSTPISYQWLKNNAPITDGTADGVSITGAATSTLSVSKASTNETGTYKVVIVFKVEDGISVNKTCQITSQSNRSVTVYATPDPNPIIVSN